MEIIRELMLQPSIFVGLIVLVGLFVQKRPFADILVGTVKTVIGYQIIITGSGIISDAMVPFGEMFQQGFHISGTMLSVEAAAAVAIERFGTKISVIMFLGLVVNLILAKITRFHYVFTTGQYVLYMACMIVSVLEAYDADGIAGYLTGALAMGIVMVLSPAMVQKYTKKICKNDTVALGHFGSFSYLLAAWLGKIYGNEEKSAEKITIPKSLSFIRNTSVTLFLTMAVVYVVISAAAGSDFVETQLSGGENYIVYAISQAVYFTIGFVVISMGIRWLLEEIVPAVRGFAKLWIPNAKPTIDCPFVFPYAPNALIIGFLCSFLGGICSMGFLAVCDLPVILPGAVAHFFCGATAGIYGNSTGGIRGTCLGGFVNGVLMSVLPLFFFSHIGVMADTSVTFADSDFGIVAACIGTWMERVGIYGTLTILICIVIIMVLLPEMLENREKDKPWFMGDTDVYNWNNNNNE